MFPVMHGPYGEDGSIQGFLEMAGVPYVGAGVLGSAIGMDKAVQKVLFAAEGIRVVEHEVVVEREWEADPGGVEARAAGLGFPLFVKPAALGSSVGISKVHDPPALRPALEEAFRYGRKAVIERAVDGAREIECAVLGNDDPVASIAGEIVPRGHEFYDYEAKYLDEHGAELLIPARIEPEVLGEVQRLAIAAFRAIDGAGMARVDFFLAPRRRPVPERGEHDPRVHEHLDVPEALGGIGDPLPRARRPADRARDRASRGGAQEGHTLNAIRGDVGGRSAARAASTGGPPGR